MLRDTFYLLRSQLFCTFTSLVFTVYFVRILSPEVFAVIAVYDILQFFINSLAGFGFTTTANKRIPSQVANNRLSITRKYFFWVLTNRIIFTLLFTVLVCVFSKPISFLLLKDTIHSQTILYMSVSLFSSSVLDAIFNLATTLKDFEWKANQVIYINLAQRVFAFSFYQFWGLNGYFSGFSLVSIIFLAVSIFRYRNYFFHPQNFHSTKLTYAKIFNYSIAYNLNNWTRSFFIRGDQFLVGVLLSPSLLAAYNVAKRFTNYLSIIFSATLTPFMIKFLSIQNEKTKQLQTSLSNVLWIISFIFIPISLLASINSRVMITFLAGNQYAPYSYLLSVLFIVQIFVFYKKTLDTSVFAFCKPKQVMSLNIVSGTSSIVLSYFFISYFSVIGATLGILLSSLIAIYFSSYLLKKHRNLEFQMFHFKENLLFLIVLTPAGYASAYLHPIISVVFSTLIVLFIYLLLFRFSDKKSHYKDLVHPKILILLKKIYFIEN